MHFQIARDGVDPPKPRVVTGGFVFGAWVAQANKQFDHVWIIPSSARSTKRPTEVGLEVE
jgi:hypothetical protein